MFRIKLNSSVAVCVTIKRVSVKLKIIYGESNSIFLYNMVLALTNRTKGQCKSCTQLQDEK